MTACSYTSRYDPAAVVSARDFGYWAVSQSAAGLESAFAMLAAEPFASTSLIRAALASPRGTKLLLLASAVAAHWAFAAAAPRLRGELGERDYEHTLASLKIGAADGIKGLTDENGERLRQVVAESLVGRVVGFFRHMSSDLESEATRKEGVLARLPSETANAFLVLLASGLRAECPQVERIVLSPAIDAHWLSTVKALDHTIVISIPNDG